MKNITRNGKHVQYLGEIHSTPELMVQLDRALALGAICNFRTSDGTHYRFFPGSPRCPRQLVKAPAPEVAIHADGTRVASGDEEGIATGLYCISLGATFAQVTTARGSHWNHAHLITPLPYAGEPSDPAELAAEDRALAEAEVVRDFFNN